MRGTAPNGWSHENKKAQGQTPGSVFPFELGVSTTHNRMHAGVENTDSSARFDLTHNTNQPDAVFCPRLVQTHCNIVTQLVSENRDCIKRFFRFVEGIVSRTDSLSSRNSLSLLDQE